MAAAVAEETTLHRNILEEVTIAGSFRRRIGPNRFLADAVLRYRQRPPSRRHVSFRRQSPSSRVRCAHRSAPESFETPQAIAAVYPDPRSSSHNVRAGVEPR